MLLNNGLFFFSHTLLLNFGPVMLNKRKKESVTHVVAHLKIYFNYFRTCQGPSDIISCPFHMILAVVKAG